MQILTDFLADDIRKNYCEAFLLEESEYYKKNIFAKKQYSDGLCYEGYLWDCYANFSVKPISFCEDFLETKSDLYVLWDIHSSEKIFIPNYWKYPKSSVLVLETWSYDFYSNSLPEDVYIFDKSFSWTISYTHERLENGLALCYFANPK